MNLIDFGASHHYADAFIDNYIEVVKAAALMDKPKIIDYSIKLGFLTGKENEVMLEAHAGSVITVAEPFMKN